MRALGHGSLSSLLKLLVDAAWVIACAALAFVWVVAIISVFAQMNGGEVTAGVLGKIAYAREELFAWTLLGTIACVGTMAICTVLRGIFETLVAGDPFVPENAVRLRKIAFILAGLELSRIFIRPIVDLVIHQGENMQISIRINLIVWGAVLVLVVLSQIFDEGARLREDQKMTI